MFATCLHCHADLGRNDEIEAMPVGRMLAFDGARGRLWVVCGMCGRWNLTPLEARWEAIETAERLWRETPTRFSSGEIGLAKRASGLRLVRIGRAEQEEFAFWRFGQQLKSRKRKALLLAAVPVGALALHFGGALGIIGFGAGANVLQSGFSLWDTYRTRARLEDPDQPGRLVPVRAYDALKWTIGRTEDGALRVERPISSMHLRAADRLGSRFDGDDAARALTMLLPVVNRAGAGEKRTRAAVRQVIEAGNPERYLVDVARSKSGVKFETFDSDTRLAIELASAEARERRYLEGELKALEWEWREAERIAAIADDLLMPQSVTGLLARLRDRSRADDRDRPASSD